MKPPRLCRCLREFGNQPHVDYFCDRGRTRVLEFPIPMSTSRSHVSAGVSSRRCNRLRRHSRLPPLKRADALLADKVAALSQRIAEASTILPPRAGCFSSGRRHQAARRTTFNGWSHSRTGSNWRCSGPPPHSLHSLGGGPSHTSRERRLAGAPAGGTSSRRARDPARPTPAAFQGGIALQAQVVCAVDLAYAALAEFRDDLISAEASPGGDGHGRK